MLHSSSQVIREGIEAWNRRDFDEAMRAFHPEIEWRTADVLPDVANVYRGPEEIRAFWDSWAASWEDIRIEPDEIIDVGDRVLVLARFRASGRGGIEVNQPIAQVWTMRDGLIQGFQSYWNRAEGLDAVGLGDRAR